MRTAQKGKRGRLVGWCVVVSLAAGGGCKDYDVGPSSSADGGSAAGAASGGAANGGSPGGGSSAKGDRCGEVDGGSARNDGPTIGGGGPGDPPCNGDWGSGASAACPTRPGFCSNKGVCTICGDCSAAPGHPRGSRCSSEGMCGAPCPDGACPSGEICSGGACVPIHQNGDAAFLSTVLADVCTKAASACASGIASLTVYALDHRGPPTSGGCFCGKQNGAPCASAAECSSGVCASNGKCGGIVGDGCRPGRRPISGLRTDCQSDSCSASTCTCVARCSDDAGCGSMLSGAVCEPVSGQCVAGCRKTGGNGCAYGESCSSTGTEIGTCSR